MYHESVLAVNEMLLLRLHPQAIYPDITRLVQYNEIITFREDFVREGSKLMSIGLGVLTIYIIGHM